jgi:hemolysin activation/secretion protein
MNKRKRGVSVKKILTISTLALLANSFIVSEALAVAATEKHTTAIVTAQHRHKNIAQNREISSERHRVDDVAQRAASSRIKKELSKVSWAQHADITKVVVIGNRAIGTSEIRDIIEPYLKGGVTKKEAEAITDDVERIYIKKGYFLPVTHIEIIGSTLKVTVVEGKIRDVLVVLEDEKRDQKVLSNQRFLDLVKKIEQANPIKTRDLERYLLLINKIHGYRVEYELETIENPVGNNVADLVMAVSTRKGTASISVDNAGTPDLGRYQIGFAGQAYNTISNDSLILNLGATDKRGRFRLATAGYLKRLNSYGTSANIFASYMENDPYWTTGSKYSVSTVLKGEIEQYAVLNSDYSVKLELAAEERRMKNYIQAIKTSEYNYIMGYFGGKIKILDPLGVENWFYPYYNWTMHKAKYKADSLIQPADFDRNFNFFTLDWYRNQPLPRNFSFFLKASYQQTNRLLPIEHRYSINTGRTARGYNTGLVSADQGITGIAELRYTKEFEVGKIKKFIETAQVFGFYDITHYIKHNRDDSRRQHPGTMYFNRSTLPATGAGLRLFLSHGFYSEGTAEYPIRKDITIDGVRRKNKPVYRFVINKEFSW